MQSLPEVGAALGIQSEVGGVAEDAGEDEGGGCGHAAAVVAQLVSVLGRDAHGLCKGGLGQAHLGLLRLFGDGT